MCSSSVRAFSMGAGVVLVPSRVLSHVSTFFQVLLMCCSIGAVLLGHRCRRRRTSSASCRCVASVLPVKSTPLPIDLISKCFLAPRAPPSLSPAPPPRGAPPAPDALVVGCSRPCSVSTSSARSAPCSASANPRPCPSPPCRLVGASSQGFMAPCSTDEILKDSNLARSLRQVVVTAAICGAWGSSQLLGGG